MRYQRHHPPAAILGAGWNDGHGAGLHLSSLTEPLPQHRIRNTASSFNGRMLCFWSNAGSNPVEARWAQWPHAKKLGSRMGAVYGRRHEPVVGLETPCSHGPSAVPHAGTVFRRRSSAGRAAPSLCAGHRSESGRRLAGGKPIPGFHEIKEIPMTAPNNVTPRSFGR